MDAETKYELAGKLIYGVQRAHFQLALILKELERHPEQDNADEPPPELELDEMVELAAPIFARRRAGDAVAIAEFSQLLSTLQRHETRLQECLKDGFSSQLPGDAEIEEMLTTQQQLERIRRELTGG